MTFPGDGLLFSAIVAFLVVCCYVSLVHLAFPATGTLTWPRIVFAALAATGAGITWRLGRLRQAPLAAIEALPDPKTDSPLVELHDFVSSMRRELEETSAQQRLLAHCIVFCLLLIVGWGGLLWAKGFGRFAQLLMISAGLSTSFLMTNWRPYPLARSRHSLAKRSAWVAEALSEQIRRLDQTPDLSDRSAQEWIVVQDALHGRLVPDEPPHVLGRRSRSRR
jgi:hypothetical protein